MNISVLISRVGGLLALVSSALAGTVYVTDDITYNNPSAFQGTQGPYWELQPNGSYLYTFTSMWKYTDLTSNDNLTFGTVNPPWSPECCHIGDPIVTKMDGSYYPIDTWVYITNFATVATSGEVPVSYQTLTTTSASSIQMVAQTQRYWVYDCPEPGTLVPPGCGLIGLGSWYWLKRRCQKHGSSEQWSDKEG
jgi:hypothetical protein